jgi:hypothetical protein
MEEGGGVARVQGRGRDEHEAKVVRNGETKAAEEGRDHIYRMGKLETEKATAHNKHTASSLAAASRLQMICARLEKGPVMDGKGRPPSPLPQPRQRCYRPGAPVEVGGTALCTAPCRGPKWASLCKIHCDNL